MPGCLGFLGELGMVGTQLCHLYWLTLRKPELRGRCLALTHCWAASPSTGGALALPSAPAPQPLEGLRPAFGRELASSLIHLFPHAGPAL